MGGVIASQVSLTHGWLPVTAQVVAAAAVAAAVGGRRRAWYTRWLPWAGLSGIGAALGTGWYISSQGLSDATNPAPRGLWLWIALTGAAVAVLVLGWRAARWPRRTAAALAVPLCLACAALALDQWTGYVPTVQSAWNQATEGPLPDQTEPTVMTAMRIRHAVPARGTVVPVDTGAAASGFRHRREFVYLPPAWYASTPPPRLPTVLMIGGEFNTPADWIRAGEAVTTIDRFAAAHRGYAPVFVFVDAIGTFNNDTECVNGPRGNSADHLTKDVVPFLVANYGVSRDPAHWGVVGWSMGGTCAVDLTVTHPELFGAFEDIAGDLAPNAGNRTQTVDRLFGGDAGRYAAFDPTTVMTRHGRYDGVAGRFDVNADVNARSQAAAANSLCAVGRANGIDCSVVTQPGKHDWPFAAHAFAAALPWLAGRLGTPAAAQPVGDNAVR